VAENQNSVVISKFVSGLRDVALPSDVVTFAKQSLIDWFAVCLAARTDPEASLVADVVHSWRSQGRAVAVDGRTGSAAPIALINATYSHALDYDDFHIGSVHHVGGPTFAAALALAMDRGLNGEAVLRAFVAGFEVSTRMGMNETGVALGNAGWHPTCILGHFSSAIACASLLHLGPDKIERAIGFAAAQVGGLMSSAGTIAKPFLVGKSAFAGVVSVDLADKGASVPGHLLEDSEGLFVTLLQKDISLNIEKLGVEWQVIHNTFKPYSACQLTHASIDAAKAFVARINPEAIASARAYVNPFALKIAGRENPATSLQARFSLKHCIAKTLLGHGASPSDFNAERIRDVRIARLGDLIEIVPTAEVSRTAARLEVTTKDGNVLTETIPAALGSLERPMSMADTERKFLASASDTLGSEGNSLLDALKHFEEKGSIEEVVALLRGVDSLAPASAIAALTCP
jgi:2-methylcitrate dehydratase PrpD